MSKKLPLLRKQKLSKNVKYKYDKIRRNLQTANRNWNDWKFHMHWNMIEWVNPRSKSERKKSSSTYSNKYYIDQYYRTAHWISHSKLKTLD